jgi:protein-S-isoprenylcysteine O-methyltransferase Ste14
MNQLLRSALIPLASGAELRLTASVLLWASTLAIVASVVYKFVLYSRTAGQVLQARRPHIVETFTMTAVIFVEFRLLQRGVGAYATDSVTALFCVIFGGVLVLLGTVLHLAAKRELGRYWSNQIEIRGDHRLVTSGPYSVVRHPMYSSLLMWLTGIGVMFTSYAFLAATWLVFLPMMISRARAEDRLLEKADTAGFRAYAQGVHQLVPRFKEPISLGVRLLVIVFLGSSVIMRQMSLDRVIFLFGAHFTAGLISSVAKVRFSFINKSFLLLVIFGAAHNMPAAYWLYSLILLFDIWGLKYDCPCMLVYEKFHGCPCFNLVKRHLFSRQRQDPAA